jgi:hypothetical protein
MSSFRRGACALACGALLMSVGCDKKREAAAPPPSSGMPPLDQPAATAGKPSDRPVHEPSAAAGGGDTSGLPPGHPPVGATGGAAAEGSGPFAGATPGGDFDPKTVVAGVIKVDAKVKDKIAPGDTIFVVARKYEEGATGPGTPLAVKKLTAAKFPLPFALDSRDSMLAGTKLAGKVVVTVRVDKDGDAISKNPGDVTGQSKPVEPPQKNVVVSLDTVL